MIRRFRCAFCLVTITSAHGDMGECASRGLVGEPPPHEPEQPAARMTRANVEGAAKRAAFGRRKRK